jgi:phosphomannomutase
MTTPTAATLPIKFGTDGWRALIAEDYTFENVRYCAQALCLHLKAVGLGGNGVVVGYDTRFRSEDFAVAATEVITGNGFKVYLCDRAAPTPVVSFTIQDRHADSAVIITSSHNPAEYNGFKIKTADSSSAPQEMVDAVEAYFPGLAASRTVKQRSLHAARALGLLEVVNPVPAYDARIHALLGKDRLDRLRNAGLQVKVDSMYGAGAGYFRRLLKGGATAVGELNGYRNPAFPGIAPEPIARNLGKLMRAVPQQAASVGLATDGDADRLGVVDEHGEFVTQLQVYALLAWYLLEVRGLRGPLIKSITTSSMIYRLGERYHVPVIETDVGFKYIGPAMVANDALMGGEESGGYGFRGHIPERDGILAGLYFLDLMVATGKTPSELLQQLYSIVGPHYYDRRDLHFPAERRGAIIAGVATQQTTLAGAKVARQERFESGATLNGVRFTLADNSWLLVRFSGTEPVLRVYAEAASPERVQTLLDSGVEMAGL